MTKTLVGLTGADAYRPGDPVTVDGQKVGTVTSAAHSPSLGPLALAVVKRPHNTPGVQVTVGEQTATVAALPFTV